MSDISKNRPHPSTNCKNQKVWKFTSSQTESGELKKRKRLPPYISPFFGNFKLNKTNIKSQECQNPKKSLSESPSSPKEELKHMKPAYIQEISESEMLIWKNPLGKQTKITIDAQKFTHSTQIAPNPLVSSDNRHMAHLSPVIYEPLITQIHFQQPISFINNFQTHQITRKKRSRAESSISIGRKHYSSKRPRTQKIQKVKEVNKTQNPTNKGKSIASRVLSRKKYASSSKLKIPKIMPEKPDVVQVDSETQGKSDKKNQIIRKKNRNARLMI